MKHLNSAVLTLFAAAFPIAAQTSPCEALNDSSTYVVPAITGFPLSGMNARAYELIPSQSHTARSIRIVTENTFFGRFMALEIYDSDPGTGKPGNRLGRGVWKIDTNRGVAWQGANLDKPVSLVQGTQYWIVWRDPGGSQLPHDAGGTQVPSLSLNPLGWASTGTEGFKFRLYCSLLDSANLIPVGNGCTNTLNREGTLFCNEEPLVGNLAFAFEGSGFANSAAAVLLLGVNPAFTSLPLPGFPAGCMLHTDVVVSVTGATGAGSISSSAAGGHVLFPLGIPNLAVVSGAIFRAQLGVLDVGAAATIPVVMSNGMVVLIP